MIWRAEGFHCINCGAFVYPRYKTLIQKSAGRGTITSGGRDTHHCHGTDEDCDKYLEPAIALIEAVVPGVRTEEILGGNLKEVKSAKELEKKEVPWT